MAKLKITLVRSKNGLREKPLRTLQALGLHKINSVNVLEDTPAIRGMIAKVSYLVKVEEA